MGYGSLVIGKINNGLWARAYGPNGLWVMGRGTIGGLISAETLSVVNCLKYDKLSLCFDGYVTSTVINHLPMTHWTNSGSALTFEKRQSVLFPARDPAATGLRRRNNVDSSGRRNKFVHGTSHQRHAADVRPSAAN